MHVAHNRMYEGRPAVVSTAFSLLGLVPRTDGSNSTRLAVHTHIHTMLVNLPGGNTVLQIGLHADRKLTFIVVTRYFTFMYGINLLG